MRAVGGGVHGLDIISRPFNYTVQNVYIKIWIGYVWEIDGSRGVRLPSNDCQLLKRTLEPPRKNNLLTIFYSKIHGS